MTQWHLDRILQMRDFNPGGDVWSQFQNVKTDIVSVIRDCVIRNCAGYNLTEIQINDLCYQILIAMQQKLGGS